VGTSLKLFKSAVDTSKKLKLSYRKDLSNLKKEVARNIHNEYRKDGDYPDLYFDRL
jgi:hypothetical protein